MGNDIPIVRTSKSLIINTEIRRILPSKDLTFHLT